MNHLYFHFLKQKKGKVLGQSGFLFNEIEIFEKNT